MMNPSTRDDWMSDLLAEDDGPRETILQLTDRVIRGRRRRRRSLLCVLPVLTFGLGYGVADLAPSASPPSVPRIESSEVGPPASIDPATPAAPTEEVDPLDLEIAARIQDGPARSQDLLVAGDRWLRQRGDLVAATRCYVAALESGESPEPSPTDSWLLLRLKATRTP